MKHRLCITCTTFYLLLCVSQLASPYSMSQHAPPYSTALARCPIEALGHVGLLILEAEPYSVDLTLSCEAWLKSHTET